MQTANHDWKTWLKKTGRGLLTGLYFLFMFIATLGGAFAFSSDFSAYKKKRGKRVRKTALGFNMPLWLELLIIAIAIIFCITLVLIYYPF